MADTYIDPGETQVYGPFAREQMVELVAPLFEQCADAVRFCVSRQQKADEDMAEVLGRSPPVVVSDDDPVEEVRDFIQRFAGYVTSIKGHPVPLSAFFGNEVPSKVARRRLLKLKATLRSIDETLEAKKAKLPDSARWLAEVAELRERLDAFERAKRSKRADELDWRPEVAEARQRWLAVYSANKALIEGILMHANKVHLMPVVFDDLAETQRTRRDVPEDDSDTGDADTGGPATDPST